MDIRCAKCGQPNMLGAIFCRNCGEKLDIETMRPEVKETKTGGGLFGLIRRLIGILIFLGLVGVIVAMFIPAGVSTPVLADDAKKLASDKYDEIMKKIERGYGKNSYTFTPDEVTFLYNDKILAKPDAAISSENAYAIEEFVCSVDTMGFLEFFIKTKLAGKVPTSFQLKGLVGGGEGSPVTFMVNEARMGRMPIKFLEGKVQEKFNPILDDQRVTKVIDAISKIEINDSHELVVTLSDEAPSVPAAAPAAAPKAPAPAAPKK